MIGGAVEDPTARTLRAALVATAALATAGTAVELAMARHWETAIQLIPWASIGGLVAALGLVAWRPNRTRLLAGRAAAAAVAVSVAYGVFNHVQANHESGPLDFRYADRWPNMSGLSKWWAAFTESVGPSPSLAPAILTVAALCVVFATIRHSGIRR